MEYIQNALDLMNELPIMMSAVAFQCMSRKLNWSHRSYFIARVMNMLKIIRKFPKFEFLENGSIVI